jgi:hypothetical protein
VLKGFSPSTPELDEEVAAEIVTRYRAIQGDFCGANAL